MPLYIIIAYSVETPGPRNYELATRQAWVDRADAEARAASYDPSHRAIVVTCPDGLDLRINQPGEAR